MTTHPAESTPSEGFTLIELIITIAIIGILSTIAIPGFSSLRASTEIATSINTFVTHLHLARSESIKRGVRVVMCPSTDQAHCTGGIQWHKGFILFADANRNRKRDQGDELIKVIQKQQDTIKVLSTPGRTKLTYHPTGMSPGSNATIRFCPRPGESDTKAVIISNTGRPHLADKKRNGAPYTCA